MQFQAYPATFILSGSTAIVHAHALSYAIGNGTSLLHGGINMKTDYYSSQIELQDAYNILKYHLNFNMSFKQINATIQQRLLQVKCSTMFLSLKPQILTIQQFENDIIKLKQQIEEVYSSDLENFSKHDYKSKLEIVSFAQQYVYASELKYYKTLPFHLLETYLRNITENKVSTMQFIDEHYIQYIQEQKINEIIDTDIDTGMEQQINKLCTDQYINYQPTQPKAKLDQVTKPICTDIEQLQNIDQTNEQDKYIKQLKLQYDVQCQLVRLEHETQEKIQSELLLLKQQYQLDILEISQLVQQLEQQQQSTKSLILKILKK
ncbi:Hypothetical_protein [Hexamita inflata]|uniref:Hypothetical_protein n=1 Tax=Hexamita inflata TaxID=28002 RepID=A0ABP1GFY5_9EUKA